MLKLQVIIGSTRPTTAAGRVPIQHVVAQVRLPPGCRWHRLAISKPSGAGKANAKKARAGSAHRRATSRPRSVEPSRKCA